ncbi:MAG: hypothetical protein M3081_05805 [Gemmatimonadota bacterium]|nr:hypothetical protein [Gemmatimonadota bacterium]
MKHLLACALGAASISSVAVAGAQSFAYAPGTTKYHVSTENHQSHQMQGQTMEVSIVAEQFITVTLVAKARDTIQYIIVLDSSSERSSMPMGPQPDLTKLRGLNFTGVMSPSGKRFAGIASDGDTTIGGQKAWKITRTATTVSTGAGVMSGQRLTIESTAKARGSVVLTPSGLYLSSWSSQDQTGKMSIPAMSIESPTSGTITTKVEIVK